ncbi:efflux RND transporter periplasmic adaptor subunit [Luteimonas wenzhouensis]|jgi:membrane fusion protein (multidrug efflux system)|uniref:Efflux RND transporter periplasmic adaptor subunit n=1 Tax=Luteimonas wenzhouensis TaxID=2599615 RepID=A0A5C5U2D0_9GAMM|nr:efflux RND transporter periplasmic adaptor subunit [Luteimonas wenzhouensis]NLW95789.1 efflux RND transporter periplasmic adaptor subunit [Xanthomonadaceae bacterium]TWT19520.1 efflux RND transporter periplasmic adaptor subunit [Luteimonas wenzhouensis]
MRRLPACVPLLLLLAACGGEPAPQTPPPPEVGVIRAEAVDLPLTLEVGGRLSAYRSADVRARVPGVLQQRVYTEGSDVEEGQVLFLIDPAPLQAALGTARAALAQAEANHANARANAERARRLAPQNYVSAADLDNALAAERSAAAAVEAARAAVESARINLGYATVRSPIAGRAGRQRVTEGALVGQGEATLLTTVDQIDPLYANFSLGVGEVDRIRQARAAAPEAVASVDVVLPDGSPHPHAGTLDFSGDVVDPATGAISLRAVVPNPERRLLPGTYVSLRARLGQLRGVFAIPQAAVQRDARGAYVLVVGAEGQVARRDVALERAEGGNWIVSSGLEDGEQVIVSGLQKATIGGPATPVPWTPQGQAPGAPAPAPEGDDAPAEGGDEAPGRD